MKPNCFSVDIAMMKIVRSPDQLCCLGLGSCVGVAVYDPAARLGGLIHILLPSFQEFEYGGHLRTKFADSGISDMVREMMKAGAEKYRLRAKIAGGADMLENPPRGDTIGRRNVQSCKDTLRKLGIELVAQDVGGTKGRTIVFDSETGLLVIRMTDWSERAI